MSDRFSVDFEGKTLEGEYGKYRVIEKIDEGGMGSVYSGRNLNLKTKVVIKVPHTRFLGEPGFRDRFAREIERLIGLSHPHICRIQARGEHDGVPFFILDFLAGGSLDHKFKRAAVGGPKQTMEEILDWFPKIAETLDFIHKRGVVHRDVKPGNILFDDFENVYLSDFGIAKAVGEEVQETSLTATGGGIGSPLYMSPEQGLGRAMEGQSDQYALAATVYQALSGKPPFSKGTAMELIIQKAQQIPPALSRIAPQVPEAVSDVVMRALSVAPQERFASCRDFVAAYQDAMRLAQTQQPTRPVTPVHQTGHTSRNHPPQVSPAAFDHGGAPRRRRDPTREHVVPAATRPARHGAYDRPPSKRVPRRPTRESRDNAKSMAILGWGIAALLLMGVLFFVLQNKDNDTGTQAANAGKEGRASNRKNNASDGTSGKRSTTSKTQPEKNRVFKAHDVTPPTLHVSEPALNRQRLNSRYFSIKGRALDGGAGSSGLARVTFVLKNAKEGGEPGVVTEKVLRDDGTFTAKGGLFSHGAYRLIVTAIDKQGLEATATRHLEWLPPKPWEQHLAAAKRAFAGGDLTSVKEALARARKHGVRERDIPKNIVEAIKKSEKLPDWSLTAPQPNQAITGKKLVVSGSFQATREGDHLRVTFDGTTETARVDEDGNFMVAFLVPNSPGTHRIMLRAFDANGSPRGEPRWRNVDVKVDAASLRAKQLKAYNAPAIHKTGIEGLDFVFIPAGTFRRKGETITISTPFYMATHELTNSQFNARRDSSGRRGRRESGEILTKRDLSSRNQPVVGLRYIDMMGSRKKGLKGYVGWLNERGRQHTMRGRYDLPTEAEWEYACRAGTSGQHYWSGGKQVGHKWANAADPALLKAWRELKKSITGWDAPDGYKVTAPVGQYPPNPWGLYDMLGNAAEWCKDWYSPSYMAGQRVDPHGPDAGAERVTRGGSWSDGFIYVNCTARRAMPMDYKEFDPKSRPSESYLRAYRIKERLRFQKIGVRLVFRPEHFQRWEPK